MSETLPETSTQESVEGGLQAQLDKLERESQESHRRDEQRVIHAELKVEAMRADMIDLDGLRFLDMTQIHLDDHGNLPEGTDLIKRLKRAKPWLFASASSSSVAKVPLSSPARQKLAKDMSDDEYRVARANIIKRTAL